MPVINFTQEEIQVLKSSIALRRNESGRDSPWEERLLDIEERLKQEPIEFKTNQRNMLLGCIRNLLIYPNAKLMKLTNYEMLLASEELRLQLKKIDVGLSVMNKLKKKKDPEFRTFASTLEKIDMIKQCKKVHYSEVDHGSIYKVGIDVGSGKGVRIELDGADIERFEFEKPIEVGFKYVDSPENVLQKLESYSSSKQIKPTENEIRVIKILQLVCQSSI